MENLFGIIPEGVEDIFYHEYEVKENAILKVKDIFKSYGYRPISTPSFEYYDLFYEMDSITDRDEMFKLIDENGKILVLRPDMTIPIARIAALNFNNIHGSLKLSYVENVYRRSNNGAGYGKKEFVQAGIEYFGKSEADSDAEVIAVGIKSLIDCSLTDITIEIGHVGFVKGILESCDISKKHYEDIRKYIESKNYDELERVLNEAKLPKKYKDTLLNVIYLYGDPNEVLLKAEKMILNRGMEQSLYNMKDIYEILKLYGYKKYITFDLGLINHINYYTGAIFKGYVNSYGREVMSGGRYDTLTQRFGKFIPATGLGLNIDEIMEVIGMGEIGDMFKTDYILIYSNETRDKALSIASKLRENNFIVETELLNEISLNNSKQAREVVYISKDGLKVKNMENGAVYVCKEDRFLKHVLFNNIITPIH